jgi:dTDP-glucose 4,6-dehydratase
MNFERNILITGGAGFIGNHVVRLFVNKYSSYRIVNLDALTYAGNLENLRDVEDKPNYVFEKANILEVSDLERIFSEYKIDSVIHLAAESHVDRSILSPLDFVYTNIIGTVNLLNTAKKYWKDLQENYSIIFPLMRFLEVLENKAFLLRQPLMLLTRLILHLKHLPIIL